LVREDKKEGGFIPAQGFVSLGGVGERGVMRSKVTATKKTGEERQWRFQKTNKSLDGGKKKRGVLNGDSPTGMTFTKIKTWGVRRAENEGREEKVSPR